MVSDNRMARGKGFVVWRMEVYCSSNSDRMFLLYCNLHETLKDLYAGCCKSGLRTDSRVKGLSKSAIIRKHILRNSFIPVMTQLPMSVAMCITGSFFIESIFSIPGIGQYYVTAVNNQDLSIVLGETVLLSILYIAVIFITDILYVFVDPRIQMPGKRSK